MFANDILKDQIALVSGGGSGIGFAIAKQLLQAGAKVIITSRKEEKLVSAAEKLNAFGSCRYLVCDIRQPEQIEAVAQNIQAHEGRLDILVNNAGGQFPSLAKDISYNGWNAVVNNNLNGTWYMTQIIAKTFFISQNKGRIVNIIANIFRGFAGMAHTGAARAGVENLTKSLAVEWAKHNIQINAVAPGIIQSTGLDNYPPQMLTGISDTIPAKRLGTTDEVAALSVFLCVPMTEYITGETIYIDGGQRLWGDLFK